MALSQTLTDQQIRENLNALEKSGKTTEERQSYVDNYQKDKTGNYNLKTTKPIQSVEETPTETFGTGLPTSKKMTAQEFVAQKPIQQYAQAFVRTLPKDVYDFAIKNPIDFLKSVGETVGYVTSGGKEVPDLGGFVSESKKALESGANPFGMEALVKPAVETIASGAEVLGAVKAGEAVVSKISESSKTKQALDQTMSTLSKTEKQAVEKTGSKLTGVKPVPTKYDKEVAEVAKPFLDKNIVKSETNLKKAIKDVSENEILPQLKNTSTAITKKVKNEIIDSINKIEPLDITKADPTKNSAFNLFKDRVLSAISNAKNDEELFKIRQILDEVADTQSGGKMWDETGKLNPIQEFWKQAYRSIGKTLKERNPQLEEQLSRQSKLFDALDGVSEKTAKLLYKEGTIQKTGKSLVKKAIPYVATAGGVLGASQLFK